VNSDSYSRNDTGTLKVSLQLTRFKLFRFDEAGILSPVLFLVPVVGVLSSKAMVLILAIALLLLAGLHIRRGGPWPRPPAPLTVGLAILLAWSAVGLIGSPLPEQGARLIGPLAGILLAGMIFLGLIPVPDDQAHRAMGNWFIWGFFSANFLLFFEAATTNFISRKLRGLDWSDIISIGGLGENLDAFLNNGIVILALMMWPVLSIFLRRKNWVLALLSIGLVVGFSISIGHMASLAAVTAGACVWGSAYLGRKITARLLAAIFVIAALFAPILVQQFTTSVDLHKLANSSFGRKLPSSAVHRLFIWDFTAKFSLERPVTGWGLNASRALPGGGEKFIVYDQRIGDGKTTKLYNDLLLPLHPHNQLLQIWLELGAIGAVIVALFGGLFILKLANIARAETPVFGLIVSYLAFSNFSFGAWQSWWIATIFLVVFIWRTLSGNQTAPDSLKTSVPESALRPCAPGEDIAL